MNVPVESYVDAFVAEDFAQRFYVNARLNAARCESVTKRVEMCVFQPARRQDFPEMVSHNRRLDEFVGFSCEEEALVGGVFGDLKRAAQKLFRQGNFAY